MTGPDDGISATGADATGIAAPLDLPCGARLANRLAKAPSTPTNDPELAGVHPGKPGPGE